MATVFVNRLVTENPGAFEALYAEIAEFMLTRPGLQRYLLTRSMKDARVYFNIAEWDTPEQFREAIASEEFRALFNRLKPMITGDPHLSEIVQHRERSGQQR